MAGRAAPPRCPGHCTHDPLTPDPPLSLTPNPIQAEAKPPGGGVPGLTRSAGLWVQERQRREPPRYLPSPEGVGVTVEVSFQPTAALPTLPTHRHRQCFWTGVKSVSE